MSIWIEVAMGFFVGLLLFIFMPVWTLGSVNSWFMDMAMSAVHRGILLKRLNSGFSLKSSRFNSEDGTEQIIASGQEYDFSDKHAYMSRFRGRPFGMAHEARNVLVTPRIADFGRRLSQHVREGTLRDDQGRMRKHFEFEPGRVLVDMDNCLHVIQGSAPPQLVSNIKEYVRKGQSNFNTSQATTYLIWLMMFGAGAAAPYVLLKLQGTLSGSGGISNPLNAGIVVLLLLAAPWGDL